MPFPDRAVAEAWLAEQGVTNPGERLAYCGGAPLIALRADDAAESRLADFHQALQRGPRLDPFSIGAACVKQGLASTVESLQKWVHDLAALRLTGELRYHASQQASLQALAETVDLPKLLEYQRLLNEARRTALHPLNAELQIESLLIQYTQLFVATARP
jgi:DNA polymerase-3 subunit delta'